MPVYTTLYVIFNGPSGVGKTTAANILTNLIRHWHPAWRGLDPIGLSPEARQQMLRESNSSVVQDSFVTPLKHFIAVTLGVKYNELKKDIPIDILQGDTARRFIINLSEEYIKDQYGDDFFGRALMYRVLRLEPIPSVCVVDSSQCQEELDALQNRMLIRMRRSGYDFGDDSRKYLDYPDIELDNDGSIEDLSRKLIEVSKQVIDHKAFRWNYAKN